jgi:ketosteroid isomerase-like protein
VSPAGELERLVAESAIRQVVARYGRAIDSMDWDLLRSCYHPDAIDEHGVYNGGIEGFIELLERTLPTEVGTNHFMGASLIELDGDTAWVETHALGHHRSPASESEPLRDRLFFLRYADRFELRDGEWRIAHRVVVYEPGWVMPVERDFLYAPAALVGVREHAPRGPLRPGAPS